MTHCMKSNLQKWRDGSGGFFLFLQEVKPRILTEKGTWEPYQPPNKMVRQEIATAIDSGAGIANNIGCQDSC